MSLLRKVQKYLLKPQDPALLGYLRIAYGCLMTFDLMMERGMSHLDSKYNDDNEDCRFPLFHGMLPMSYHKMVLIHMTMLFSILCILFGFMYRITTFVYMVCYWYIFLLNKTAWNNHSYLFGLFSIMFFYADANNYMSVDAWLYEKFDLQRYFGKGNFKNKHVPNIQYFIPRLQIFLLYFFAALKKTDADWLSGFSMGNLGRSHLFDPLRWIGFSTEQVNFYFVHLAGFFIDLFSAFLLIFDKTRKVGYLVMISFHGMNSQLFNIGMFPYTCLATMFIFCHCDSFRKLIRDKIPTEKCLKNPVCYYDEDDKIEPVTDKKTDKPNSAVTQLKKIPLTLNFYLLIGCLYVAIQLFLPWSHFITLGYNGWTQGTYGYSWDMMIYSFSTQHTKIYYKDPNTGDDGYLREDAFTSGRASSRWTSHPEQLKQYAVCLNDRLKAILGHDETAQDIELYFDCWKSMNKRFHQRTYDPRVNIVKAAWSPFQKPGYTLPLMMEFDDMRDQIRKKSKEINEEDEFQEVTFIADFPGLRLENFLAADFKNTTVELISGQAKVEFLDDKNREDEVLEIGKPIYLPPDQFHNILTIGETPSCYMYIYENNTHREFINKYNTFKLDFEKMSENEQNSYVPASDLEIDFLDMYLNDLQFLENEAARNSTHPAVIFKDKKLRALEKKLWVIRRTLLLMKHAVQEVAFGKKANFETWKELHDQDFFFPDWLFSNQAMTHRQKKKENWEKYIADQKVKYEKMQAGEIEPTEDEGGDQDGQSHGSTQSSDNAEPVADTPSEKLKPESDTNPADSSKNQEL